MSAPIVPTRLTPKARSWGAWEHIWDALADGEWHRGAALVNEAHAAGLLGGAEPRSLSLVLLYASRCGLIERETRVATAFKWSGLGIGSPVRRAAADPWYRRRPA